MVHINGIHLVLGHQTGCMGMLGWPTCQLRRRTEENIIADKEKYDRKNILMRKIAWKNISRRKNSVEKYTQEENQHRQNILRRKNILFNQMQNLRSRT